MAIQASVGKQVRRWLAAVAFGLSIAGAPLPATVHAQGVEAEYQGLIQKGLHEYDLGNFSEAKAFFTRAHALSPNARTLRGLGMSAYELRNYVEAIDYFQRSLGAIEPKQRPLTPQMRTEVTQLLGQARSFVTKLALDVQPAQARVRLDAREVVRDADGNLLLDPGTHELVVEAPDYETVTRNIRTDGGESLSLDLHLRSTREPAQTPTVQLEPTSLPAPAPTTEPAAPRPAPAEHGSLAPWIVVGASGAVAVAGGVLLAVALSNKHAVENPSGGADGPRYADYAGKADSVLPLSAAGITALSLGLAGVAAGVIWKLSDEHADARPSARLRLSPGALTLDGRF